MCLYVSLCLGNACHVEPASSAVAAEEGWCGEGREVAEEVDGG